MIQLRTLGALDLRGSDGRELRSILAQPKRLALLAYLAVSRPHGYQRREQVLALFWPEQDTEHARAALNRAIYYLRHSLGVGILLSRGDEEIGVSGEVLRCDAVDFQVAAAEGRHRDAVELYRGELLEGFFISDAPDFERWLGAERDRLRALASSAGWALANAEERAGNKVFAAHWARWAAERSPYDEAGVHRLMVLLDGTGDRAGAVRVYEEFARRLASDLELWPSPETRALVESIRVGNGDPEASASAKDRATDRPGNSHRLLYVDRPEKPPAPGQAALARVETVGNRVVRRVATAVRWPAASRARMVLASVAGGLVLITAILVLAATGRTATEPTLVVVAPFQNRTGDPSFDRLGRVATDWIAQHLEDVVETASPPASAGGWRVDRAPDGEGDLRLVARRRRAGTAVSGAIYRDRGELRFHASVLDALRGGMVWTIGPISAPLDAPEAAMAEVRQRVAGAVAVLMTPGRSSWFPLATAPPTYEAYLEFILSHQLVDRPREALAHNQRAIDLDTTFVWALTDAVVLHRQLGEKASADSILHAMDRNRRSLPRLQAHWLDWMLAMKAHDDVAAYRAMKAAAALAPEPFLHPFALSARELYRPRESVRLLKRLSGISQHNRAGPAGWRLMAESYHQLREHQNELEVVRQVGRDQRDPLDALWHEVRARAALGQIRQVMALLDTALSFPRDTLYTPGGVMLMAAEELRAHGHSEAGAEALERAIAWYQSRPGDESVAARNVWSLASALYLAGGWARPHYERQERLRESDSLFRKIASEDPRFMADVQGYLGAIAARQGDRGGAERVLAGLERLSDSTTRPPPEVFYAEARIRALLGDTESAISLLRDWRGGQGADLHTEVDFESLVNHPQFREFTRPKG